MGQVGLNGGCGFGDFSTRANETDMLMRNSNTGAFEVYDISNNAITSSRPMGQVGLEWTIAGFGDFSGNANETDMLMRDSSTGAFELYDISNNSITLTAEMGQVGMEWSVAGISANFLGRVPKHTARRHHRKLDECDRTARPGNRLFCSEHRGNCRCFPIWPDNAGVASRCQSGNGIQRHLTH